MIVWIAQVKINIVKHKRLLILRNIGIKTKKTSRLFCRTQLWVIDIGCKEYTGKEQGFECRQLYSKLVDVHFLYHFRNSYSESDVITIYMIIQCYLIVSLLEYLHLPFPNIICSSDFPFCYFLLSADFPLYLCIYFDLLVLFKIK